MEKVEKARYLTKPFKIRTFVPIFKRTETTSNFNASRIKTQLKIKLIFIRQKKIRIL